MIQYVNFSDTILILTGMVIAWQAWETRRLAELTRIKDQPLLEIEFQNGGARVLLKNIGQSPAYSPSISSIQIAANEYLDFDPLHISCLPILVGEIRPVWMHHQRVNEGLTSGFAASVPVLMNFVVNRRSFTKITLQYFDKDGIKLSRDLYIKVSGTNMSENQQVYTTTTCE